MTPRPIRPRVALAQSPVLPRRRSSRRLSGSRPACLPASRRPAFPLWLAVIAFPALAPAQEPPRTVIRAETQLVLVEAAVQDKKGNSVKDLSTKDFHIWEDGKEQPITSLSLETAAAGPAKAARHYLVLFFDNSSLPTSQQLAIRRDAARFAGAWAAPDRNVSVVDFGPQIRVTQGFTALPGPLQQAISQAKASGQPVSERSAYRETRAAGGDQSSTAAATIPDMDASSDQIPARPGAGARGRGGPPAVSQDQALAQSPGAPFAQLDLLSGLQSVAESLASIRGRKSLVLFTGGFPTPPSESQMDAVISACNAANVAVYVANPGSFKSLADGTGGRIIANANDLVDELGHIAEQQEEHYVLAYAPPDSPPGTCHNLRVTVDRPGVDVDARKGYCNARPTALVASARTPEPPRAAGPALAAAIELPYFYSSPNVARVNLAMELPSAAIRFDKSNGKPHAELRIAGIASQSDGSVAGRFEDVVKLDFDSSKESAAFAQKPYHYEYQFDLAPGKYNLRVTVASGGTNLGGVEAPLSIDPWDGSELAVSGIAFAKETRPVADLASTLDDASLEDRRPLIAGGHQIIPSGSNRFQSGAFGMFYVEFYDRSLSAPNSVEEPRLTMGIRILDRQSGQPKLNLGTFSLANYIRQGNPVVPVAGNIPESLPPGSYRLELTATNAAGARSIRTADFEVEP